MRKFVTLDNDKVIKNDLTLLDKKLVVKTKKEDGTIKIEPILSTSGLDKSDIELFEKQCRAKGKELLYEVDDKFIEKNNLTDDEILLFRSLSNGTYHQTQSDFEPKTVRLLEYEVVKNTRDFNVGTYKTVVSLRSTADEEALYIPMEKSVILVANDTMKQRREALARIRLGSDLYVYPNNEELVDKYEDYVAEFEEVDKEVFHVKKRTYYFIRDIRGEELEYLSENDRILYNRLAANSSEVSLNGSDLLTINRYDVDLLLINGIDDMPLRNLVEVYTQEGMNLTSTTLEEVVGKQNHRKF